MIRFSWFFAVTEKILLQGTLSAQAPRRTLEDRVGHLRAMADEGIMRIR